MVMYSPVDAIYSGRTMSRAVNALELGVANSTAAAVGYVKREIKDFD